MLMPSRYKHRYVHKGRVKGDAARGNRLAFGNYGLQVLVAGRLDARQIEAARVALTRHAKRGGKVWIRVFPDHPYSKKPLEVRQGKGKGNLEGWQAIVWKGTILYEIEGVDETTAREAMKLAGGKLPLKTRFIKRQD